MGFFKKLFGTAAVTGAAVGGALYVKKRKEEKDSDSVFEDFDDKKIFDVNSETNGDDTKVTFTFNKKKAKKIADDAADKVIDATAKAKDTIKTTATDKFGEEKVNSAMDKMNTAKEKLSDAADVAKDIAKEAKEIVVDKVGEDNIQAAKDKVTEAASTAKDKVMDAASTAKEKVSETVDKIINPSDDFEDDFVDEDFFEEDFEEDTPDVANADTSEDAETEDDVKLEPEENNTDNQEEDDEFLSDELDEL